MSRLTEWVDREESLLSSNIKELERKITRAGDDINTYNSEMAETKESYDYLMKVKKLIEDLEGKDDTAR